MKIMSRLLTNHPLVNILFTVVVAMGLMSYFIMPREQDPEINFYWVNINTVLPGASAEDVEKLVTAPLTADGTGLLVSASRSIIYAGSGANFADDARQAAMELRDLIKLYR